MSAMPDWTKQLTWLSAENSNNPFSFEVLDCRSACAALGGSIRDEVDSIAAASIEAIVEASPAPFAPNDGLTSSCLIVLQSTKGQIESLRAAAVGSGDRWLLQTLDRRVFFRRRWTGQLIHAADFVVNGDNISIEQLTSDRQFVHNSRQYAVAEFEFLLSSYLARQSAAFPIPPQLNRDHVIKIALHGWKTHGSIASFARFL
jgi:hypothetical protein